MIGKQLDKRKKKKHAILRWKERESQHNYAESASELLNITQWT